MREVNENIMEIHDIIDLIERDIFNELGMIISIHMELFMKK
jgi:hypothetical protein